MKRVAACILSLVFLVTSLASCTTDEKKATEPSFSDSDRKTIDEVSDIIKSSQDVVDEIAALVEKQVMDSQNLSAKYRKTEETGQEFDTTSYDLKLRANHKAVKGYIEEIKGFQKDIDKIGDTDSEQAAKTITAASEYFSRLSGCLDDLNIIMTFYADETDAQAPINDYDAESYGDDVYGILDGLYTAIDDTIINFRAIETCPDYMRETFDNYIEKVGVYEKMIESMYLGYSLDDPLRSLSADELFERQSITVTKCELDMFDLFTLQFEKVSERLNGNVSELEGELLSNCKQLANAKSGLPDINFTYLSAKPKVTCEYETVKTIYPNLYSDMDSVINFTATTDYGTANVLIKAEIPGFTQEYQQKAEISGQVTRLLIKPVVLTGGMDLSSSRDAMLNFSVTDNDTGEILVKETRTISLMSIYDFMLTDDEFGETSRDNVLAWLTPESEGILELRRNAVTWLEENTDGELNSLIGYQDYGIFDDPDLNTYIQIVALQSAISGMGVRYNMGSYSLAEGYNQRVLLPDDVLSSQSGICIETAILFATAIQSADMHAMILFLPGHAQVAVETQSGSGMYYLVETTMLPFDGAVDEMESLVTEMTSEDWAYYLEDPWGDGSGSVYVVDCDLIKTLGIQGIDYQA